MLEVVVWALVVTLFIGLAVGSYGLALLAFAALVLIGWIGEKT